MTSSYIKEETQLVRMCSALDRVPEHRLDEWQERQIHYWIRTPREYRDCITPKLDAEALRRQRIRRKILHSQ